LILVYDSIMVPELGRKTLHTKDCDVFLSKRVSESEQSFFSLTIKESLGKASFKDKEQQALICHSS
jgi:hypothetical protein